MAIDRVKIEDRIWPLVEAANASGYETVSSCEGHADKQSPAEIVFLCNNDEALRIDLAIRQIEDDLVCHWELTARFIHPADRWTLGWKLENWGIKKCPAAITEEWWRENTEAARKDVHRLSAVFQTFVQKGKN
jgi:hypothetical protein